MGYFKAFSNLNSHMLFPISENLAILPYLFRAIRIRKLFECREVYCVENKIPRQKIERHSEKRYLIILGIFMVSMAMVSILLFVTKWEFYNFASIDGILDDHGDGSFID